MRAVADQRRSLEIIVEAPVAEARRPAAGGPPGDPAAPRTPRVRPGASHPRRTAAIGGAAAVLLVLGVVLARRDGAVSAPAALDRRAVADLVDARVSGALAKIEANPARSATVYRTILPSIVVIRSAGGDGPGRDASLGTGVVVNADGSIMTAFHVVEGATTLTVTFADGTESAATVRTSDPASDIAVLTPATKPEVIVAATLGGGVRIGDETYAVGHPLGLVGSLSAGVISGLDRSIPRGDGAGRLTGLIQFDAAVNPGNSGGPLLDRNGRVVGIVTAIADPSQDGSFIGIGFAVPIATAGGTAGAPPR